jgi:hypothetical protein
LDTIYLSKASSQSFWGYISYDIVLDGFMNGYTFVKNCRGHHSGCSLIAFDSLGKVPLPCTIQRFNEVVKKDLTNLDKSYMYIFVNDSLFTSVNDGRHYKKTVKKNSIVGAGLYITFSVDFFDEFIAHIKESNSECIYMIVKYRDSYSILKFLHFMIGLRLQMNQNRKLNPQE